MADSARAQHEADKANLEAARLETIARHEEIKSRPQREQQGAQERIEQARQMREN